MRWDLGALPRRIATRNGRFEQGRQIHSGSMETRIGQANTFEYLATVTNSKKYPAGRFFKERGACKLSFYRAPNRWSVITSQVIQRR